MLKHRLISGGLITIAIVFATRLYLEAPWYLDRTAFLIHPLLQFALPLLLIGIILWLRPTERWPPLVLPILLLCAGFIALLVQGGWPEPNLPTSWEDSYQTLAVLEIAVGMLQLPVWLGSIGVAVWPMCKTLSV